MTSRYIFLMESMLFEGSAVAFGMCLATAGILLTLAYRQGQFMGRKST